MLHCTEKGSIMRTGTVPSLDESFFPFGTREGSKSAGIYLLRTLRSPIVNGVCAAFLLCFGTTAKSLSFAQDFYAALKLIQSLDQYKCSEDAWQNTQMAIDIGVSMGVCVAVERSRFRAHPEPIIHLTFRRINFARCKLPYDRFGQ